MPDVDLALLKKLQEALPDDPEMKVAGRFFTCTALLASGPNRFLLRFGEGRLRDLTEAPHPALGWSFAVKAEPEVWQRFLQDPAPAEFHDIWAAAWLGHMTLEGDMLVFMQNHYAFWRALKLLRSLANANHGAMRNHSAMSNDVAMSMAQGAL